MDATAITAVVPLATQAVRQTGGAIAGGVQRSLEFMQTLLAPKTKVPTSDSAALGDDVNRWTFAIRQGRVVASESQEQSPAAAELASMAREQLQEFHDLLQRRWSTHPEDDGQPVSIKWDAFGDPVASGGPSSAAALNDLLADDPELRAAFAQLTSTFQQLQQRRTMPAAAGRPVPPGLEASLERSSPAGVQLFLSGDAATVIVGH